MAALGMAGEAIYDADPDDERLFDVLYHQCAYARGFDICSSGCWEEPHCVTSGAEYSVSELLALADSTSEQPLHGGDA